MELLSFRVRNYRSIQDSGEITVSQITALLGRNESGKSNLLRALHSLNPIEGFEELSPIKDFPRHRRLEECKDETPVLSTTWKLSEDDKSALLEILPRATDVATVDIGRTYKNRTIGFPNLKPIPFDDADVKSKIKKVGAAVRALAHKLENPTTLESVAESFEKTANITKVREAWATQTIATTKSLRTAIAGADEELTDKQEEWLSELEELAESIAGDKDAQQKARSWAISVIPTFIYVSLSEF